MGKALPVLPIHLGEFTRALDDASAAAKSVSRKLVMLSISQVCLDRLGSAIAALGWHASNGELVSLFVGLPIELLPAGKSSITVIDDQSNSYCLV